MRVLVLWADGNSANLGVRALAEGSAQMARLAFGNDVEIELQDFTLGALGTYLTGQVLLKDLGPRRAAIARALGEYDLILNTGSGDSFSDIYGHRRAAIMALTHHRVQKSRTPMVFAPQTIGPFNSWIWRRNAARVLKRSPLTSARDSASATYAASLGTPVDVVSTDVVFTLPVPERRSEYDVLLNVSGLLSVPNPHVESGGYLALIRALIRELLSSGRGVKLLPHVLENPSADCDIAVSQDLAREFGIDVIVPTDLTDVRQSLAGANVLIGSRMHACLNALSVGTPALPMAYSRKFDSLMRDIGWEHTLDLTQSIPNLKTVMRVLGEVEVDPGVAAVRLETDHRVALFVESLQKLPL